MEEEVKIFTPLQSKWMDVEKEANNFIEEKLPLARITLDIEEEINAEILKLAKKKLQELENAND